MLNNKKGFTLVEMIVTFALLTLFMASIAATLAPISKQYSNIQKINHIQNIQDGILESCKAYIQQASSDAEDDGYLKLREVRNGMAKSVNITTVNNRYPYKGSVIEFKSHNLYTTLDTRGYKGYKVKNSGKTDFNVLSDFYDYPSGYLSVRYYAPYNGTYYKDEVEVDTARPESGVDTSDANAGSDDGLRYYTCYGAYQCFDANYYMGYKSKVVFSLPKEALFKKDGKVYANYVIATVRLSDVSLGDATEYYEDSMPIYFKNPLPYGYASTSLKYDQDGDGSGGGSGGGIGTGEGGGGFNPTPPPEDETTTNTPVTEPTTQATTQTVTESSTESTTAVIENGEIKFADSSLTIMAGETGRINLSIKPANTQYYFTYTATGNAREWISSATFGDIYNLNSNKKFINNSEGASYDITAKTDDWLTDGSQLVLTAHLINSQNTEIARDTMTIVFKKRTVTTESSTETSTVTTTETSTETTTVSTNGNISFTNKNVTITAGETGKLSLSVQPANSKFYLTYSATGQGANWVSSATFGSIYNLNSYNKFTSSGNSASFDITAGDADWLPDGDTITFTAHLLNNSDEEIASDTMTVTFKKYGDINTSMSASSSTFNYSSPVTVSADVSPSKIKYHYAVYANGSQVWYANISDSSEKTGKSSVSISFQSWANLSVGSKVSVCILDSSNNIIDSVELTYGG